MSTKDSRTSRRAFVVSGGATLGAGVAAAVAAAGRSSTRATPEEREAIRKLHAGYIADVENASRAGAEPTHRAYRANARQLEDTMVMTANGRSATATWNVDVKTGMPLEGDSTIEQMARLQGHLDHVQWETGRLEARYEKTKGEWRLTAISYRGA